MFCIRTICRDLKRLSRPRLPALFFGVGAAKTNRILVVVFEPSCTVGLRIQKSKLRDYIAKGLIEADAQRDAAPALFRPAEPPRTR